MRLSTSSKWMRIECYLCKILISDFFLEIDKSSADVAAEGAILNEMLEIVAKRAALRPTDTMVSSDGGGGGAGYDVSEGGSSTTTTSSLHLSRFGLETLVSSRRRGWRRSLHISCCSLAAMLAISAIIITYLFPALLLDLSQN